METRRLEFQRIGHDVDAFAGVVIDPRKAFRT